MKNISIDMVKDFVVDILNDPDLGTRVNPSSQTDEYQGCLYYDGLNYCIAGHFLHSSCDFPTEYISHFEGKGVDNILDAAVRDYEIKIDDDAYHTICELQWQADKMLQWRDVVEQVVTL